MYSQVVTGSLQGLSAELVTVEVDLAPGLPNVTIVGLPDTSVREARERIRTAMSNAGYRFPTKRITVNLSPADSRKEGTHFDLPIAVGVMAAAGDLDPVWFQGYGFFGELSLDGRTNPIHGALPLAIGLRRQGIRKLVLPLGNEREVSVLEDVEIYPISHLLQVEGHLTGANPVARFSGGPRKSPAVEQLPAEGFAGVRSQGVPAGPKAGLGPGAPVGDFADVAGHREVKRALQLAAAAAHNLLMVGPPGAGKTMMARLVPGILPPMTYEERLEVTNLYSIAGELPAGGGLMESRPFRAPHHTITSVAMAGGGARVRPGEISLAHYGVLFLDELPEFQRRTLEVLRQPLEEETITVSRASASVTYPSKIMLIAAMNPCPCGYYGSSTRACTCSEFQIRQYLSRVSGPLLDRIDMQIEVIPIPYVQLAEEKADRKQMKTSKQMREEVDAVRQIQLQRYREDGISYNSQLTPAIMEKYCSLKMDAKELLKTAYETFALSPRAHHRILKLSRTIADMEGKKDIEATHIAEALRYRSLDKNYGEPKGF